jgi:hypothetical protein
MRGQLSKANSYADVKSIVKKTVEKMYVEEAKALQKQASKIFAESAKKMK